jgi:hypothetical protein
VRLARCVPRRTDALVECEYLYLSQIVQQGQCLKIFKIMADRIQMLLSFTIVLEIPSSQLPTFWAISNNVIVIFLLYKFLELCGGAVWTGSRCVPAFLWISKPQAHNFGNSQVLYHVFPYPWWVEPMQRSNTTMYFVFIEVLRNEKNAKMETLQRGR